MTVWELRLSKRELEVAIAVAAGLTNKEIAKRLGVSPTTVKTHLERIFEKMQVSKRLLVAQKLSADEPLCFRR